MKLKVGDIELDSDGGIAFDGRPAPTGSPLVGPGHTTRSLAVATESMTPRPAAPVAPAYRSLDSLLPEWRPAKFLSVSVGVAVSTAAAAWAIVPAYLRGDPLGLLIFTLVPFGLLSVGSGLAAAHVHRRGPRVVVDDPAVLRDAKSIAALLRSTGARLRVEDIAEQLALSDAAAAAGLVVLVRDGVVDEDVDVDTGTWTYHAQPEPEDAPLTPPAAGRRAIDVVAGKKPSDT